MKKIILCSLVAMMAVTAANAEIASVGYVDGLVAEMDEVVAQESLDKFVTTVARVDKMIGDSHGYLLVKEDDQVPLGKDDELVPTVARAQKMIDDSQSSLSGIIGDTEDFQEGESVMGFVDANTAAIAEIKHEENGILAAAKQYTNDEISELSDSLAGTAGSLTTLTQTVTDLDGVVDTLNGDANTAGSVKKQIADAIADEVVRANNAYDAKGAAADALQAAKEYADANDADTIYDDNEVRGLISDAQATADAAVTKTEVGIGENFKIPADCKAEDAVCSLVVRAGVAGWEKIRY